MEAFLKPAVLVVDDNEDMREILRDMIEDEGYPVILAKDGLEALEKATVDIGLILLDVEMPGMDGIRTANALQLNPVTKQIPILFLSGWTDDFARNLAYQAGAFDFLDKPVRVSELHIKLKALTSFIGKANVENKRQCFGQAVKRVEASYLAQEAQLEEKWFAMTA